MSETDEHSVIADWLTDVLRAGGVLPHGSVDDLGCEELLT